MPEDKPLPPPMDPIEQAAIIQCYRDVSWQLGLGNFKEAANKLILANKRTEKHALNVMYGRVKDDTRELIARTALEVLEPYYDRIIAYYSPGNPATGAFITSIFAKHRAVRRKPAAEHPSSFTEKGSQEKGFAEIIFANWRKSYSRGAALVLPGLYQVYRRYKPSWSPNVPRIPDDPLDIPVICELLYIDSDNLECLLVSGEGYKYTGTMHINHEDIVFGLLQRPLSDITGFNHRFIAMKSPRQRLNCHWGLTIKVGNTTHRPVSSECIFVKVPKTREYEDLLTAFDEIWSAPLSAPTSTVSRKSVVYDYLTDNPPSDEYYDASNPDPEWARVKFVRDFPALAKWVMPDESGMIFFREPSRTLLVETILGFSRQRIRLGVFKHSRPSSDDTR
jgi:hypothetical protein